MNIRVRFSKEGEMKYVGHLDLMRYFQKAIRRAGIDVAYSEGFNPHQIISFASPLGLGITSEGEYFDVRVNSSDSSDIMVERLNAVMAGGVKVLSWKKLPEEGKTNAMASLCAASYLVTFNSGLDASEWEAFATQDNINTCKITKKSEIDIDIKPLILDYEIIDNSLKLLLAAGSEKSIKTMLVLNEFYSFMKKDVYAHDDFLYGNIEIKRIDQYTKKDELISLNDVGENI